MSRIQKLYKIIFDVISDVEIQDSGGALRQNDSPTVDISEQPGKLDFLSGTEVVVNDRNETVANYRLFCDEIEVSESQFVRVGSKIMSIYSIDDTLLVGRNPHMEILLNYKHG